MSYKTDTGDGGRGAPPTNLKVKGYKRRYQNPRIHQKKAEATSPEKVTFRGLTKELKGHI